MFFLVAQLAWPEAATIIDVGANKGKNILTYDFLSFFYLYSAVYILLHCTERSCTKIHSSSRLTPCLVPYFFSSSDWRVCWHDYIYFWSYLDCLTLLGLSLSLSLLKGTLGHYFFLFGVAGVLGCPLPLFIISRQRKRFDTGIGEGSSTHAVLTGLSL